MSKTASFTSTVAIVRFGAVVTAAGLLLRLRAYRETAVLVEAGIYLALFLFVGTRQPIRHLFAQVSPGVRGTLLALLAGLVIAQLADQSFKTYPFANWAMYTTPVAEETLYYEHTAVLASGQEMPLPPLPGPRLLRCTERGELNMRAGTLEKAKEGRPREVAMERYNRAILTNARILSEQTPSDPVRQVRVVRCAANIPHAEAGVRVVRTDFHRLDTQAADRR